jgi:hypothetical protein
VGTNDRDAALGQPDAPAEVQTLDAKPWDAQPFKWRPSVATWCRAKLEESTPEPKQVVEPESPASVVELRQLACDCLIKACLDGSLRAHLAAGLQASSAVEGASPKQEVTNDQGEMEDDEADAASCFVSNLLLEVVDDYSDEAVFEITHKYEAPRIFAVPEPAIPEEDESVYEDADADEDVPLWVSETTADNCEMTVEEEVVSVLSASESVKEDTCDIALQIADDIVWSSPAELRYQACIFSEEQGEETIEEHSDHRLEDIKLRMRSLLEAACENGQLAVALEDVRSEVPLQPHETKSALKSKEDPAERFADIKAKTMNLLEVACENGKLAAALEEIHEEEKRLEGIKTKMRELLQGACDNGNLAMAFRSIQAQDAVLPSAAALPPCTRPSFARKLMPVPAGPPVSEEPFPCDCLPPSTSVAKAVAPSSEAWLYLVDGDAEAPPCTHGPLASEAHERACRALASAALQELYARQGELATKLREEAAAPNRINPASSVQPDLENQGMEKLLREESLPNRNSLAESVQPDLEMQKYRHKAREALVLAAVSGKLDDAIKQVTEERQILEVRDKLKNLLVDAMEDGRLEDAFRQTAEETNLVDLREQARDALIKASGDGMLEQAMREVAAEFNVVTPMAEVAVPEAPRLVTAPAAPSAGSPSRRRPFGARTFVAAQASQSEASGPPQPQPLPSPAAMPQTTHSPVRRVVRAHNVAAPAPGAVVPQAPPAPRSNQPGSRPKPQFSSATTPSGGMVPTPPASASGMVPTAPMPRTPTQPAGAPSGGRRPVRPSALGSSIEKPVEEAARNFRLDMSPDTSPEASATHGRSSSIVDGYRTLGTAQFFCMDGSNPAAPAVLDSRPQKPTTPKGQLTPRTARAPASASVTAILEAKDNSRGCLSARGSGPTALELDLGFAEIAPTPLAHVSRATESSPRRYQKMQDTSRGCLSARGSGPTALELDLGFSEIAPALQAHTPRAAVSSPRFSKRGGGNCLLPMLPSKNSNAMMDAIAWSMTFEHNSVRPQTRPRSARSRTEMSF